MADNSGKHTIDPDDIARVLKQFDRRKQDEERVQTAETARKVASGLGTHTPTTLLADIRQCMVDMTSAVRENTRALEVNREESAKQHREQIAFLSKISEEIKMMPAGLAPWGAGASSTAGDSSKEAFYYGSSKISSGVGLIGCILMQLDSLISRSGAVPDPPGGDSVDMQLKNWSTAVQIVSGVTVSSGTVMGLESLGSITLPAPKSPTTYEALKIVGSTVEGRHPVFTSTQLSQLVSKCQTVMSTVDEVRRRLLLCPGLLSIGRYSRLARVSYPFADEMGQLSIASDPSCRIPSRDTFIRVLKLKQDQKKAYVSGILAAGKKSIMALIEAESVTQTTSVGTGI